MQIKQYLDRIRIEFPEVKFNRATMPKQGLDHVAIFLDDQWVFRFVKNPEYAALFPNEVQLLCALQTHITLPIPNYTHVSKDKSFGGYKKIQGQPLTRAGYRQMSHQMRKKIASTLANFLCELHTFPSSKARALQVPREDPQAYLSTLEKDYRQFVEPRITPDERAYCEEILLASSEYCQKKHPVVMTHNDLHGQHIYFTSDRGITGIIDFGDRAIGDPAKDFCGLLDIDPSLQKAVFDQYDRKDPPLLHRSLLLRKRGSISWLAYNAKAGSVASFTRAYRQLKSCMTLKI